LAGKSIVLFASAMYYTNRDILFVAVYRAALPVPRENETKK